MADPYFKLTGILTPMDESIATAQKLITSEGTRLLQEADLSFTKYYLLPGYLRDALIELLPKIKVDGFTCDTIELEQLHELEDWMEKGNHVEIQT